MQKIKFKINGLHCKSCKTLLESEVGEMSGVKTAEVDYRTGDCSFEFDENQISFKEIKNKIESFDYQVADLSQRSEIGNQKSEMGNPGVNNFLVGLLVPLVVIGLVFSYFYVKNTGALSILAKLNESNLGYGLLFFIGFLASFHCVGMCGGLVVTYSAASAVSSQKKWHFSLPHLQYNLGRLVSYTIVGGILGGVGSFFAINPYFSGGLMLFAGAFMSLMAVSLFTDFKFLEKLIPRTPQFIAKLIFKQSKNSKTPLVIGLMTGLMPCGPLQAMQLYALGTGSVTRGALSLAAYALGTIPLMFGFGAFISYLSKNYMKKIMKISAVVVGVLALVMINRGLTNFGLGVSFDQGATINQNQVNSNINISNNGNSQLVKMDLTYAGYQPNVLYVKKGIPVRWVINVKQLSGCTSSIILQGGYNISRRLQMGENIIEFTPTQAGEIPFSCGMQMVWGKFIVE
ncbi:MAG: sulfite exporter TauE/SafE family protein [Patescibacteria group bacterium]|jgi:sulfite exporter TauE/SafE/copper chaperone CopZ